MNTLSTYQPTPAPSAWQRISDAFGQAIRAQCHPKMLGALLVPFLVAFIGAIVLLWLFWTPLKELLVVWLTQFGVWEDLNEWWLVGASLVALQAVVIPILAAGMLLPLAGIAGLIVAAVVVMPLVLSFVEKRAYPQLKRQGRNTFSHSFLNAAWVGIVFVVGWLVTLPLWLFPPFALLLPVFWWAFAFSRLLRVDSLVEHASAIERKVLLQRYSKQYWLMGLIMSLLNLLPPAWLVLPVFSALVFAYFNLAALAQLRSERTLESTELNLA